MGGAVLICPGLVEHESGLAPVVFLHKLDEILQIRLVGGKVSGIRAALLETDDVPFLVGQGCGQACAGMIRLHALLVDFPVCVSGFPRLCILPVPFQGASADVKVAYDHRGAVRIGDFPEILLYRILGKTVSNCKYFKGFLRFCRRHADKYRKDGQD